jgi:ankyrin repeat protein
MSFERLKRAVCRGEPTQLVNVAEEERQVAAGESAHAEIPPELHRACGSGDKESVEGELISQDVNATDSNGVSPLMYAARGGKEDIVVLLLLKGANVNASDNKGQSALTKATLTASGQDVLTVLLHAGAAVDHVDVEGGFLE